MRKLISLIVLNYNTKDLTLNCVNSFLPFLKEYGNYEVIIIDNNSTDQSVDYLNQYFHNYHNIKIYKLNSNLGFSIGNNFGALKSNGDYLIFSNSDTYCKSINFSNLIDQFESNYQTGLLSVKILNSDLSIQSIGFKFPSIVNDFKNNFLFWNFNFVKKIRLYHYQNKGIVNVDWLSGSFLITSKSRFNEIGGFDEKIFMYSEDLDLAYRFRQKGYKNFLNDSYSIIHYHGSSSKLTFLKLYNSKLTYLYVIKKNKISKFPFLLFIMALVHIIFLFLFKKIQNIFFPT